MVMTKARMLRKKAGYTPEEVTEKLGISRSMLDKVELGYKLPGRDLIGKMSQVYKCSIDDIYKAINITNSVIK